MRLLRKKRDEFYAKHKKELDTFKESHEYIIKVLNGNTTIPAKKWKLEQEELQKSGNSINVISGI